MSDSRVDAAYLRYQYDDAERLRIRIETHAQYSERTRDTFAEWLLSYVAPSPGDILLDAGCGPGAYHPALAAQRVRVIGLDASRGMLREARAQAAASGYTIDALAGDAQALPFRDGCFDGVMANHMLYHVPDRRAALRELRRVLKPRGHIVLATNGADNFARFDELHAAAATRLGYVATEGDALRFTLDDLPLVRSVFASADVFAREDALLFSDAPSALRYYASYHIDSIEERAADGSHRARLLREVGAAIEEIIAREGVFRVPKSAGCFVANV